MIKHAAFCLALLATLACAGCSDGTSDSSAETSGTNGGLMLVVSSDMQAPEDIDAIEIEVVASGLVIFSNIYDVGGTGLALPGTIKFLPRDDASAPVNISVLGRLEGEVRTFRRVITTIPTARVAELSIAIEAACDGQLTAIASDTYSSNCAGFGQSCVSGTCTAEEVDSATLPDAAEGATGTIPPNEVSF